MPGKYLYVIYFFLLLCFGASAGATTIEGVVVTEQGPLDGAVVKAYPSLLDALSDNHPLMSTPGKKSGFFLLDLPSGTYYLTASGSEKGRTFFSFHGANPVKVEEKSVWLPFAASPLTTPIKKNAESSRIVGTVMYKGKPVDGAQVSLYPFAEKNIRGLGFQTKSADSKGRFELVTPPASYIVIARKRMGGNGKKPLTKGDLSCFYGANPVAVEDGSETSIAIECHPKDDLDAFLMPEVKVKKSRAEFERFKESSRTKTESGISGRVVDRYGKPVKDIQVTAYPRDPAQTFQMHYLRLASEHMARTDGDGRYFIPINKPGSYYLTARQFGGESPLKGELYGLYEGNSDHAVTVSQVGVRADITVGRVMGEVSRDEPLRGNITAHMEVIKAPAVIKQDTVWSGEVLVEGVVLVTRAATLTIAPGTVIRFKRIDRDGDGVGDGELRVTGRIIARGTPEKPIHFMSAELKPRAGDWSYLLLFTSGEQNVIEHSTFEHAFTALQIHFSRAVIRDSIFRNNREGIRFGRAELDIAHNEIRNNGIGIRYHRLEGPVEIHGNVIKENDIGLFLVPSSQQFVDFSADTYIPDFRYSRTPIIKDNIIADNLKYNFQLGERLASDIPVDGNWWGNVDVAHIHTTIFDREQDPELGSVKVLPILSTPVSGAGPRKGGR